MLDFDASRTAIPPQAAATILVVRPSPLSEQLEVFCVERHLKSGFLGGAVVFPGGKVSPGDSDAGWEGYHTGLHPRSAELGEPALARGFAIAALRETLEEAAILPVVGDNLDAEGASQLRTELSRRLQTTPDPGSALRQLITERGLVIDTARLIPLWRWVTPIAEKRRFETPFYLLELPEGQLGEYDQHEITQGFWATPGEVLERWRRGEIALAPPTSESLRRLAQVKNFTGNRAALEQLASAHSLAPICPEFLERNGVPTLVLPGDPLHSQSAPIRGTEAGSLRFEKQGSEFVGVPSI